jgi:hypothetical protein
MSARNLLQGQPIGCTGNTRKSGQQKSPEALPGFGAFAFTLESSSSRAGALLGGSLLAEAIRTLPTDLPLGGGRLGCGCEMDKCELHS